MFMLNHGSLSIKVPKVTFPNNISTNYQFHFDIFHFKCNSDLLGCKVILITIIDPTFFNFQCFGRGRKQTLI